MTILIKEAPLRKKPIKENSPWIQNQSIFTKMSKNPRTQMRIWVSGKNRPIKK